MVKAHTISSAWKCDHARDREERRKRSAALRLQLLQPPLDSPRPAHPSRWRRQAAELSVLRMKFSSTEDVTRLAGRRASGRLVMLVSLFRFGRELRRSR